MDGGSSDNFIHPSLINRLNIPIYPTPPFQVQVGNEELLQCEGEVRDVLVKIQDKLLFITAFVLPIATEELVLGDIWLETLDTHLVNYKEKFIIFFDNGQLITLQGEIHGTPTQAQFHQLKRFCMLPMKLQLYTHYTCNKSRSFQVLYLNYPLIWHLKLHYY